jgi:hypothetical protein
MGQGTVIIESSFKRGGVRMMWVASEIAYRKESDDGVFLSRPLVLSISDPAERGRMENVLSGVIDTKGSYFEQVMDAVREQEKETV